MDTHTLIIDVRESDEFKNERVPGALHLPLSQLEWIAPGVLNPLKQCSMVIMCRSGGRATLAFEKLKGLGLIDPARVSVFSGGMMEWKKQGRATEGGASQVLPIMRQVQLGAGGLALLGAVLALWVNPAWVYLPLFVGAGLVVAGATGFCGMAIMLEKMPWNRVRSAPAAQCVTRNS